MAEGDRAGVSPGSDALVELFKKGAPCLVLIDEWVGYVRQLYGIGPLAGGTFDSNITFAQAITEAAKAAPKTLVVASIPVSDIEIGGEGGREALRRLQNVFSRVESPWRPASAEESFEIVRRRLFEPIADPHSFAARDAVARAFSELYRAQSGEFPSECREAEYERRIIAAYPIHPELFDRLYTDWSSLDRFQRTRGVLRLMAAVIHSLWERQDSSLLILPANVPIDDLSVQQELTRYQEDNWVSLIEKDVDGPNSLPLKLDRENPNLGRYSACRRVARTLYLGSAPTSATAHKGLEDRQIKLGSTQPGESVATFGDALRRLTDQANHLYVDGRRYWYSLQPSVSRLAQDRASQQDPHEVAEEIRRRLREEQNRRGDFAKVHPCPSGSGDIPDEREARLVILGPEHDHAARDENSPARSIAAEILHQRGSAQRIYRNTVVFLAPDRNRLGELEQAVRQHMAWRSIENERVALNLDAFQSNQATTKRGQAEETIKQRIPETYQWLLVPGQGDPRSEIRWQEIRLTGLEGLAVRASKKLRNDELLVIEMAGTRLRLELDRIPLWRGDHVPLKQLAEDFAKYLYLPRLRDQQVMIGAVEDGLALMTWEKDSFAYADTWDESNHRYRGLRAAHRGRVTIEGESLLVKPEVAVKQMAAERAEVVPVEYTEKPGTGLSRVDNGGAVKKPDTEVLALPRQAQRFHGSVALDPARVGRDAGTVAEEVIQHLTLLHGSQVEVTLEIHANIPEGVPENAVRTVTENCRTLKFKAYGFEDESGSSLTTGGEGSAPEHGRTPSAKSSSPKSDDFRSALHEIFQQSLRSGKSSVDVNAGELHRKVGGYPGPNHRMASCCEVLTSELTSWDTVLEKPPKGKGASLTIRFVIPRPIKPDRA